MVKKEKLKGNRLLHRIIKILLIVVLGLLVIYGAFYAFSTDKSLKFSPTRCEDKVWCLDYNSVAMKDENCVVMTNDCSENRRCLSGECVLE